MKKQKLRGSAVLRRYEPEEGALPCCPACRGELSYLDTVYRVGRQVVGCDRCVDAVRDGAFPRCLYCGAEIGPDNALLHCRREIIGCEACVQVAAAGDMAATLAPEPDEEAWWQD